MRTLKIVRNKLERIKQNLSVPVTPEALSRALNKEFKSMKIRFKIEGLWQYYIEGEYNSCRHSTDEPLYNIMIWYDIGDEFHRQIKNIFFEEIFYVIIHELRHGYQARQRNHKYLKPPKMRTNKEYFSFYDEVDAYAFEAAVAIKDIENTGHWIIERYRNLFPKDNPKVYNRLMKKIYKNINTLSQ